MVHNGYQIYAGLPAVWQIVFVGGRRGSIRAPQKWSEYGTEQQYAGTEGTGYFSR